MLGTTAVDALLGGFGGDARAGQGEVLEILGQTRRLLLHLILGA
jgi:hypothetical protein